VRGNYAGGCASNQTHSLSITLVFLIDGGDLRCWQHTELRWSGVRVFMSVCRFIRFFLTKSRKTRSPNASTTTK
jgi:hypothetical protein